MASRKKTELDQTRIDACLIIIRQLYVDYTPDEIVEAFARNRREIAAREERIRLENELKTAQQQLDNLPSE